MRSEMSTTRGICAGNAPGPSMIAVSTGTPGLELATSLQTLETFAEWRHEKTDSGASVLFRTWRLYGMCGWPNTGSLGRGECRCSPCRRVEI
jgi:hypothetical protein